MKREALVAGGLASALILTGCSTTTSESHKEYPGKTATTGAVLPDSLKRVLKDNILKLQTNDIEGEPRAATAVRVAIGSRTIALTAAHMLNGATKDCADETIWQPHANGFVDQYEAARQTQVRRSHDTEWDSMPWQDAAGIMTDRTMKGANDGISLAAHTPKPGTKVLLANYQELPDGNPRDITTKKGYSPALFDGTVVGTFKHKIVIATGGGDSYGPVDDFVTRGGSSGGAAVVADAKSSDYGKLAGLTIETLLAPKTAQQISADYGYSGMPDGSYAVGFIEPTTAVIGEELKQGVLDAPACG